MKSSAVMKTLLLVCCSVLASSKAEDEEYCTAGDGADGASCGSAKIDFYYVQGSMPCLAVSLAAKMVGVDLNLKLMDLRAKEQFKPEFIKMNPQHKVPTINDNGFALGESRAIMGYLVDQYAKNDDLYPKNAKKRAVVNQRLYFDIGTLYQRFSEYYYPLAFEGASPDQNKLEKFEEALGVLDKFLEGQDWVAGNSMTIADISIVSSVSAPTALGYDLKKFKNVARWFDKCKKAIPEYQETANEATLRLKKMFEKVKLN